MKNLLGLLVLLSFFASSNLGQSIRIVPRKIVYVRPNIDAENDTLGMKKFSVVYPKIFDRKAKKIEEILSYEKAFDFKLEKELSVKRGIQSLNYRTLFNSKNILSVKLTLDAYTFSDLHYYKFITINTKTAKVIEPAEVFKNLRNLAAKCRKSRLSAINEVKKMYSGEDYGTIFEDVNFTIEELNDFTVGKKGITFHYPYRFGRTSIMFEPKSDYFFSWKELKTFIKRGGLLEKFVR